MKISTFSTFNSWKYGTYSKNLAFKSVFGFYFHPPGYSVAAQARKLVYEKNPFLKIVGFTARYKSKLF